MFVQHSVVQSEVDESHSAVLAEKHVARVRVSAELVEPVQRTHIEAVDDLADPIAFAGVEIPDRVEAATLDEFRHENAWAAHIEDGVGYENGRMAGESLRQDALRTSLFRVVEFSFEVNAEFVDECGSGERRHG